MTGKSISQRQGGSFIKLGGGFCHHRRMTEIELKFQVPPERRERVRAAVAGRATAARPMRLQAAYFDTDDGLLAAAGVALRLRREGARWVQTLKASGADTMTRLEHNVPRVERSAALPALEPSLHQGTPAGQRLAALLASRPDAVLGCRYRTDIRRTLRTLRRHGARLELAFDQGEIVAGQASLPVCELEIELLDGSPAGLLAVAGEWVLRHGLWLDTRSKAERGTLLAERRANAPPRKACSVRVTAGMDAAAARRVVLAECLQQVAVNASAVASGEFAEEHVHQLRVGLRRLRTALRLFATEGEADPMQEAAAGLFRALSAARDQAAIGGPLRAQIAAAMSASAPLLAPPALPLGETADPALAVRDPAAQRLLLDLMAAALLPAPGAAAAPPVETVAVAVLDRWQRQLRRDARRFASLDDASRHRLRKHVKRLRYGVEFMRGLFGVRKTERYLRVLAALQQSLGDLNDAGVAHAALQAAPATEPSVAFALGWLSARREALAAACAPALAAFAAAKKPWRR
jgi:inorganic triphosphatase YgiF